MGKPSGFFWQGWLDSNQRMRESKSLALPLGYTPVFLHRLPALRSVWIAYTISRTEPGKHTALHNGLAQGQPLPHHFRIPFDEHASEFALHGSVRANHGTFQPCAGMSVASVSSFIAGASQIIIIRPAAFIQRTGKPLVAVLPFRGAAMR